MHPSMWHCEQIPEGAGGIAPPPRSVNPPFCGLYSWVPLMITVCAGRLTPQASVAVQHSTCRQAAPQKSGCNTWRNTTQARSLPPHTQKCPGVP